MKTIFIATDFSTAAISAVQYGVSLAEVLNAKVILFNAYNIPLSLPDSWVAVNPTEVKQTAENYLNEQATALKKITRKPIQILALEGAPVNLILEETEKIDDCMVVLGMKGEGRNVRKIFGSTVTGLLKKMNHPLLVVPELSALQSLNKMALALEKDEDCFDDSLDFIKELAVAFGAKIFVVKVLKVNTTLVEELAYRSKRLVNQFKPMDIEYVFPKSKSVTESINDFIETNNVKMLVAFPHQHSFFEKLIAKSETKKLIFHTSIPLLLLPEKKSSTIKNIKKLQHQQV